ncbi:BRICHOS domain-containing protein 5 isoform X2 [Canis lupus baileyi]|uniref:BRICHOS domain-containing protein 5 isoform X2 n=1 Tax=Canis lupus dingo TaxID=286419 RepID=UPI0015F15ECD|nr:BRICHOS domain-containing protein 5 isoform X2 [Canis lupus dingo]XP_038405597.1 BRICHOS domain-containing protein 5 isoform X2 [Canis lupus familiaris]XP_038525457.1 BRICHOS domain-containing protein 5 isoform X2 [Canis lupus familiaris]
MEQRHCCEESPGPRPVQVKTKPCHGGWRAPGLLLLLALAAAGAVAGGLLGFAHSPPKMLRLTLPSPGATWSNQTAQVDAARDVATIWVTSVKSNRSWAVLFDGPSVSGLGVWSAPTGVGVALTHRPASPGLRLLPAPGTPGLLPPPDGAPRSRDPTAAGEHLKGKQPHAARLPTARGQTKGPVYGPGLGQAGALVSRNRSSAFPWLRLLRAERAAGIGPARPGGTQAPLCRGPPEPSLQAQGSHGPSHDTHHAQELLAVLGNHEVDPSLVGDSVRHLCTKTPIYWARRAEGKSGWWCEAWAPAERYGEKDEEPSGVHGGPFLQGPGGSG